MKLKIIILSLVCVSSLLHAALDDSLARSVQVARELRRCLNNVQPPQIIDDAQAKQGRAPLSPRDTAQEPAIVTTSHVLEEPIVDDARTKAAQAALKRAELEKKCELPSEISQESKTIAAPKGRPQPQQPLFVQSVAQSNDRVEVIQLAVRQQGTKRTWPKAMQHIAVLEGGNCGYHALFNVMQVQEMLRDLPAAQQCAFPGSEQLNDFETYQEFAAESVARVQQNRKDHEQDQLRFEQLLAQESEKSSGAIAKVAKSLKAKVAKKTNLIKVQTPQDRVNRWIATPNWIVGSEIDSLIQLLDGVTLLSRDQNLLNVPEDNLPIMVLESISTTGFTLSTNQEDNFQMFRDVAPVGSMLGLIINTGVQGCGIHWISAIAVKCHDRIVLYVMDSASANMDTNVAGIVSRLSGVVQDRTVELELHDMQDTLGRLSHPELSDRSYLFSRIIRPVLGWKRIWMPEKLQLGYLEFMQQILEGDVAVEELQEFLDNQEQLKINLTQSATEEHEAYVEMFNQILAQVLQRLIVHQIDEELPANLGDEEQ